MRSFTTIFLLLIFSSGYAQVKEFNLYVGAQSLNITRFNELETLGEGWNFINARAAFSSEFSANFYPTSNDCFLIQTGVKYFRLKSQHNSIVFLKETRGVDLQSLDEIWAGSGPMYSDYDYGFDFQYFTYFISPSYRIELGKGWQTLLGVGAMIHLATTKQDGIKIITDPNTFDWEVNQHSDRYTGYDFSYNISGSVNKDLADKWALSLKAEYNFVKVNIGEERDSIWQGNSSLEDNITVPISKQNIDLTGFNLMIGVLHRL